MAPPIGLFRYTTKYLTLYGKYLFLSKVKYITPQLDKINNELLAELMILTNFFDKSFMILTMVAESYII